MKNSTQRIALSIAGIFGLIVVTAVGDAQVNNGQTRGNQRPTTGPRRGVVVNNNGGGNNGTPGNGGGTGTPGTGGGTGTPGGGGREHRNARPWSSTLGKPMVAAGGADVIYLWHDAQGVYVVTTSDDKKGEAFHGSIRVQPGSIANVHGIADEKKDVFRQPKPGELLFHFKTFGHTDGLKFQISNESKYIIFRLLEDRKEPARVLLGQSMTKAGGRELVFDLSK